MNKNHFLFIFFLFVSASIFAQDTLYQITGTVIDDKTKSPLNQVSVQISGSLRGTTTNSNGQFKFSLKEKELVLKFSIIGYEDKFVSLNYKSYKQLVVSLSQQVQQLQEVRISASNIQTVVKDKDYNVLDYDFYKENILLITYKNDLSKAKLILLSPAFDTISKTSIPEEPKGLFKDCIGNNLVICEKNIYQIYVSNNTLGLLEPQTIQKFEAILLPCIAQDSLNYYLFKKYNSGKVDYHGDFKAIQTNNHTILYSTANKFNREKKDFAVVSDEESIKMRKDEIRFERSKAAAGLYLHGSAEDDRIAFESSVTKEVYAPLYNINKNIYIFDYINSYIKKYSKEGQLMSKTPIDFYKGKNWKSWKREMTVDDKTGKAFAIFETGGLTTLKEINLTTGEINQSYQIPYSYIKNIKAHDNYIYFLDREMGYSETKFLSRLKLD